MFEWDNFAGGTKSVMAAVVEATKKGAITVIGGDAVLNRGVEKIC